MLNIYRVALFLAIIALGGCKYYGSALPPDYPMSMDDSFAIANDLGAGGAIGQRRELIGVSARPRVDQPNYIPEKELAMVAPPQTLLVWTYPHVTEQNDRIFGSWQTIFINERYEWVKPVTQQPMDNMVIGN